MQEQLPVCWALRDAAAVVFWLDHAEKQAENNAAALYNQLLSLAQTQGRNQPPHLMCREASWVLSPE